MATIVYSSQHDNFVKGLIYRNPKFFERAQARPGRDRVVILGNWPLVRAAYEALDVEILDAIPADARPATANEQKAIAKAAAPRKPTRAELNAELAKLPGPQTDPEYVVRSMRKHWGTIFTAKDEAKVRELVKAPAELVPPVVTGQN